MIQIDLKYFSGKLSPNFGGKMVTHSHQYLWRLKGDGGQCRGNGGGPRPHVTCSDGGVNTQPLDDSMLMQGA